MLKWVCCKGMATVLMIGIMPFPKQTAAGQLVRSVSSIADSCLVVEIAWDFGALPESCLIIEERIPDGWMVDSVQTDRSGLRMRATGGALQAAIGVGAPRATQGLLTYTLVPEFRWESGVLYFGGVARTMRRAQPATYIVGGANAFDVPEQEPLNPEGRLHVRLTGLRMPENSSDAFGPRLSYAIICEAEGEEGVVSGLDEFSETDVIHVEYAPSLLENTPWQCLYTSSVGERAQSPGVIQLPDEYPPGFFRMRLIRRKDEDE